MFDFPQLKINKISNFMGKLSIEDLHQNKMILLETISGSKGYGLSTPQSDTDIRGVFILPKNQFFGLNYIPQVADRTNDTIFYELTRFVELLSKNNPNILELIAMPENCILQKNPLMNRLKPELFLSKLCRKTFAGYALAQIQKAKGLNKKIFNPVSKERKSVLHFCQVTNNSGTMSLLNWLEKNHYQQENCGLVKLNNIKDLFALFYDTHQELNYKGIIQKETSNEVSLSSIPKGEKPLVYLYFNKDGYTKYCKTYKEYWEWVENRNEARYENTLSHNKNYDSKNLMHTFRLLNMAEEIARTGKIIVRRPDRAFLFRIRNGEFSYDELMKKAEEKLYQIDTLFEQSDLPKQPNLAKIEKALVEIRKDCYNL